MPGDGTLPKPVWSPRKFAASDIVTLNVRDVLPAERFGVAVTVVLLTPLVNPFHAVVSVAAAVAQVLPLPEGSSSMAPATAAASAAF